VAVNGAQSFLKLGLTCVIITGTLLLQGGTINLFTYLIFMLVGSRIYAPINEVMNHLAALTFLDVRIKRMNEMAQLPVQQGKTDFAPSSFDITFWYC
jgi:ATP-binding cassette subfamily B protein